MTDEEPGPIEVVRFQGHWIDCSECGEEGIDDRLATTERFEWPDGSAAHRPLCLECAKRLGIKDGDTTYL